MRRSVRKGWIIVSLLCFFLVGAVMTAVAAEKAIKMASVNAFSGKAAAWGFSQDRGVKMAAEKVNAAGGIKIGADTYKWEIKSYDNRFIPAEAVSSMKRAVADGCTFMCTLGGPLPSP